MIQLTRLTAQANTLPTPDTRAASQSVHCEIVPGVFVHVSLRAEGLSIVHLKERVCIPMEELLALARHHAPKLGAPGEPTPVNVAAALATAPANRK